MELIPSTKAIIILKLDGFSSIIITLLLPQFVLSSSWLERERERGSILKTLSLFIFKIEKKNICE